LIKKTGKTPFFFRKNPLVSVALYFETCVRILNKLSMRKIYELTQREVEILEALSEGLQAKEIALKYYRSVDTIRKHISNIYKKMGVRNRVEALLKYYPEKRMSV